MKSAVRNFAFIALCIAVSFTAAHAANDNSFRFVVLSDIHVGYNDSNWSSKYATAVNEIKAMTGASKPAAVFITGDITDSGYESGTYDPAGAGSTVPGQITNFKNWIKNPLEAAGIPVYMIEGNHDGNHQSTASEFAAAVGIPLYQSINIQKTHFVLTNGVPDNVSGEYGTKGGATWGIGQAGQIDTAQLNWIENDLKSAANTTAKVSIMMDHFPLFNGDSGGYEIQNTDYFGNVTNAGTKLRSWVQQYGVDMYLYGHRHAGAGLNIHDSTTVLATFLSTVQDMDTVFDPAANGHAYSFTTNVTATALMDRLAAGTAYTAAGTAAPVQTRGNNIGYDVFDVNDYTVSHYRQLISGYYQGEYIGPQQEWSITFVPEPVTFILLAVGGFAVLRRRKALK